MHRLATALLALPLLACAHTGQIGPRVAEGLGTALDCSSGLLDGEQPSTADYVGAGTCFASWVLGEVLESASPDRVAEVGEACVEAAKAQRAYDQNPTDAHAHAAVAAEEHAETLARTLAD